MDWTKLFSSRRAIVTAVVGAAMVVLQQMFNLELDEATRTSIVASVVLWLVGESAGSTTGWKALLTNPRFIAMAAALANAILNERLGLGVSTETIQQLLTLVQTLLAGYAIRPHIEKGP